MFRRPYYIAFGFVLLLGLIFISLPARTTTRIKVALGSLFLPLFGLAGSAHQMIEQAENSFRTRRTLASDRDRLRSENDTLRIRDLQTGQLVEENARLREALGWQKQNPWRLKLAQVILRDPANWWRTIQINLGQRDGLVVNLPVLTPDGLVGRISQVGFNNAQVVLLGDPNCRVSAIVEDGDKPSTSRKPAVPVNSGVLVSSGSSVLDPTLVDLTFLDRQSKVKPGQRVLTSGLGPVFPRGIPIGQISEVKSVGYGLFQEAKVKLAADLSTLREVFVILP